VVGCASLTHTTGLFAILCLITATVSSVTAGEPHWSFAPPTRPGPPKVKQATWVRNPIDTFILAELEANELVPAKEADRATLLRRLTFDLTGLPPTPQELDAFLNDNCPDAYERVVDRLLASPRYGERWAQHWLDLARFADTDGFEFDQTRPDAWRYRDWVVSALNRDVPYDRFLTLQLAGDEVAPEDPSAIVATGFNRCYPDMVDLNDQGLRRQNSLNDVTETTGLVFLGLTIGCARCHDHKTDPIKIEDFYRLQAFFTPARFRDDLPIASPREKAEYEAQRSAWEEKQGKLRAALNRLEAPVRTAFAPGHPAGLDDETIVAFSRDFSERTARDETLIFEANAKDKRVPKVAWQFALDPSSRALREDMLAKLERYRAEEPPRLPSARGVDEAGPAAPATYLLKRGEFSMKGPEVFPDVPGVLKPVAGSASIEPRSASTGRRAALAAWLARPDHPLTARVIVNRLWQHHFGQGIVATPSDFGVMGAEPSHPALLDWLAHELPRRGWRLKEMHRLMVTSATYRQSTRATPEALAADPDNELLGRCRRVRLDGEAIRDALLEVSGQLSPTIGGPGVFPELPTELTKLSSKGAVWPVSTTSEERSRRSLYVFIRRNLRYPFFEAFDRPDTNASCPKRSATTIAPQALTLLNSRIAHDSASALARRLSQEAGPGRDDQIRLLFRLAYGRSPDAEESALANRFLERDPSLERLCLAILNANEFVYID
jgi:Protein of unknown function (DUF1553)/Protein of unknown function (DUF1549)